MKSIFVTPATILAVLSLTCGICAIAGNCPDPVVPNCPDDPILGEAKCSVSFAYVGMKCDGGQPPATGGCFPGTFHYQPCSPFTMNIDCNEYHCIDPGTGPLNCANPSMNSYPTTVGYTEHYPCSG